MLRSLVGSEMCIRDRFCPGTMAIGLLPFPFRHRDGGRMGLGSRSGDGMLAGAASTTSCWSNRRGCQYRFWLTGPPGNNVPGDPGFLAVGYAGRGCASPADALYRLVRAGIRKVEEVGPK